MKTTTVLVLSGKAPEVWECWDWLVRRLGPATLGEIVRLRQGK